MLQNKAMLVNLTISGWDATRYDKSVSAEVEKAHDATDAGRYNKRLIDKAHLATITTLAGQLRQYHYSRTLPWTDKGHRLLPSALFMEYRQDMAALKNQFNKAVNEFLVLYPQLVQDARVRLKTMFQPTDYPDVANLRAKFDVDLEFMPVPDVADFRVEISAEERDEIREQITQSVNAKQAKAVKDCWGRVREVVSRIADQCGNKKGRIYDSLMENAQDLVNVLSGLNITGDPELTAVEQGIRSLIVSPDLIRTSQTTRKRVADTAAEILAKLPGA